MSSNPVGAQEEWIQAIYNHGKTMPRDILFSYFRGQTRQSDMTLPIVNLISSCCKAVFHEGNMKCDNLALDLPTCAMYLYYMVAEHILQKLFPREPKGMAEPAAQRFKGLMKAQNPPKCQELVQCEEFHLPLIECSLQLVSCITAPDVLESTRVAELLHREDKAALLWQATSNFLECFGQGSLFPMPAQLQEYLMHKQQMLLDAPVMQSGSVIYEIMLSGGGCQFVAGDCSLAHNIITAYALQATSRTQQVAWHLQQQQEQHGDGPCLPSDFHEQCSWLMDLVLLKHLDLCFGVHMSVLVACVVYVTAKVLQAVISFSTVTKAMESVVPETHQDQFTQIEVSFKPLQYGDLRAFYNSRFLTVVQNSVRSYLQEYHEHQHPVRQLTAAPAVSVISGEAAVDVGDGGHGAAFAAATAEQTAGSTAAEQMPKPSSRKGPLKDIQADLQGQTTAAKKPPAKHTTMPGKEHNGEAVDKENCTPILVDSPVGVVAPPVVPSASKKPVAPLSAAMHLAGMAGVRRTSGNGRGGRLGTAGARHMR